MHKKNKETTKIAKSSFEKEEGSGKDQAPNFKAGAIVMRQCGSRRGTATQILGQNREPGNRPTKIRPTYF